MEKSDPIERPSIPLDRARTTAEAGALLRAIGTFEDDKNQCCADDWAIRFLDPSRDTYPRNAQIAHKLKAFTEHNYPGSYYYFIARTAFIDRVVSEQLRDGVEQVVTVGAGYDSRACRLACAGGAVFIEVDQPQMQAHKRSVLERHGMMPSHTLRFAAATLGKERLCDSLRGVGFDASKRTLFVLEGLSYYLSKEAAYELFEDLSGASTGPYAVVFDYLSAALLRGEGDYYGAAQTIARVAKAGEQFRFGLDDDQVDGFLGRHGLEIESRLMPRELEQRFLTRSDGRCAGQVLGFMRVVVARAAASRPS